MSTEKPPRRPRGTGSVRYRRGQWFLRYYHHGRRVEEPTGLLAKDDRAKAETLLRRRVKAAETPQFVEPKARKFPFEKLCDLLVADYKQHGRRSRLGTKLHQLREFFGGWQALAITADRVNEYIEARLEAGKKPATINRGLAALRRAFALAVEKQLLPREYTPKITLLPENNARQGFLDPPEFAAFLDELRQREPVVADVAEFGFHTMLRRGNVLGLVWPWLSLERDKRGHVIGGEMRLPGQVTKNGRPLTLPLTQHVLAVIDRRWQLRSPLTLHVFHRNGTRVSRFEGSWRAAAAAIGHPGFVFHDLRRSGARTLRRQRVPEGTIMALGGWKTRSMFERYNITDQSDLIEAQEKLAEAFAALGPRKIVPLPRKRGANGGQKGKRE